MKYILAIDQSTSATKALLFEASGRFVDKASREHRQIYPAPGRVEHDAEEIWQNVRRVVVELLDRNPAAAGEMLCLSIANQRETVVLFERATGRPVANAIVWQCRRGDAICQDLLAAGHGPLVAARTGLRIDGYFSASKLAWTMRNAPAIAARIRSGEVLIGTIDAYLIYRLTRGAVFATDATNASRTLLFDIHRQRWDAELCALFEVPMQALPTVCDSTAVVGHTDLDGLLPGPLPICGVLGDSQAALLAHGCLSPGQAKVTLGTGASVLLNVGAQPPPGDADVGIVTGIAWTHRGAATYCVEGIINNAGATIAWLKDQLRLIDSAEATEAIARSVPDNGGVYIVPAFGGLSAPHWVPDARAAIVGLTAHSGRAHVVRAALESIAYQIADVLDLMRRQSDVPLRSICVDGGASRNGLLMQMIADLTRCSLRASPMPDCAPLGAAMAGALGMGHCRDWSELHVTRRDAVGYEPQMTESDVAKRFAGWRRAVDQVLHGARHAQMTDSPPAAVNAA